MNASRRCIAVFGGSFDPPHNGHVALARYVATLLTPDELRIIPTGQPWQKQTLRTPPHHRTEMARLAFAHLSVPVVVDDIEIKRTGPTYSIDTLGALREQFGMHASISFVMGADQLQGLHTWHQWDGLFGLAHLCVVSRPGFTLDTTHLHPDVAHACQRRRASAHQIRQASHGLLFFTDTLDIDVSSTAIRNSIKQGSTAAAMLPPAVLDYAKRHHLYEN